MLSYDTESIAIDAALFWVIEFLEESVIDVQSIVLCTDNQAAIEPATGSEPKTNKGIYKSIRKNIRFILGHENKPVLHLRWTPSHCGIPGNEEADRLAGTVPVIPVTYHSSIAGDILKAKLKMINSWNKKWPKPDRKSSWTPAWEPATRKLRKILSKNLPREGTARLIKIITGHCYCGKYYEKMNINESIYCPHCVNKHKLPLVLETREHVLFRCWKTHPAYADLWSEAKAPLGKNGRFGQVTGLPAKSPV